VKGRLFRAGLKGMARSREKGGGDMNLSINLTTDERE